jgi:thiol-disulfide isomerase/thioredoxin
MDVHQLFSRLHAPVEGRLPAFVGAGDWLNSQPLTPTDLRGKVVAVDFWTYTCINWLRTLPYLRAWAGAYAKQGLVVVGVHTPEFGVEHDIDGNGSLPRPTRRKTARCCARPGRRRGRQRRRRGTAALPTHSPERSRRRPKIRDRVARSRRRGLVLHVRVAPPRRLELETDGYLLPARWHGLDGGPFSCLCVTQRGPRPARPETQTWLREGGTY